MSKPIWKKNKQINIFWSKNTTLFGTNDNQKSSIFGFSGNKQTNTLFKAIIGQLIVYFDRVLIKIFGGLFSIKNENQIIGVVLFENKNNQKSGAVFGENINNRVRSID